MRTTYTNFADVAKALGFKVKKQVVKKEAARKCPECGNDLRHIEGTNVWVCDMFLLGKQNVLRSSSLFLLQPSREFPLHQLILHLYSE